jgi:hypothetical protein
MYRHTLYSWPQRQPVHASFFYEKQWNWRQRLPCRTWNWRQRLPCRHLEGRDCLVQQTLQAEAAIFIFYTPLCLLCCSTSRRQRLPCGLKVHKDTCWAHSWWTLLLRFQPESCWTWSWLRMHEMKAGAAWFNALGMKGHFLLWSMCICTYVHAVTNMVVRIPFDQSVAHVSFFNEKTIYMYTYILCFSRKTQVMMQRTAIPPITCVCICT